MRTYTLKEPRFKPYINIVVGVSSLEKLCTKCKKVYPLNSDNFLTDSKREYGYMSQCNHCRNSYAKNYRRRLGLVKGSL